MGVWMRIRPAGGVIRFYFLLLLLAGLFAIALCYLTIVRRTTIVAKQNIPNTNPLCTDGLLDRRTFNGYLDDGNQNFTPLRPKRPCRLHQYQPRDVVTCLDYTNLHRKPSADRLVRFVFVGDSRARQQFFNLLKFIATYDQEVVTKSGHLDASLEGVLPLHFDKDVTSQLLNIRVSFFWRPLVDHDLIGNVTEWASKQHAEPIYFILLSVGIHHMIKKNQMDHRLFERRLSNELLPALDRLNVAPERIVFLGPLLPILPNLFFAHDKEFSSDNLAHVTEIVSRHVLRYHPGGKMTVWDSAYPVAKEYVFRSCQFHGRVPEYASSGGGAFMNNMFYDCEDVFHTGFVALEHATQILLNHLCNRYLF